MIDKFERNLSEKFVYLFSLVFILSSSFVLVEFILPKILPVEQFKYGIARFIDSFGNFNFSEVILSQKDLSTTIDYILRGGTPTMIGLASITGKIFGEYHVRYLLPIAALIYSLAPLYLYKNLRILSFSKFASFISSLALFIFPSTIFWYGQWLKNIFFIPSIIIFTYVFLVLLKKQKTKYLDLFLATLLCYLSRKYFIPIIIAPFMILVIFQKVQLKEKLKFIFGSILAVVVCMTPYFIRSEFKQDKEAIESYSQESKQIQSLHLQWNKTHSYLSVFDELAYRATLYRIKFLKENSVANTNIHDDYKIDNLWAFIIFLPKAFLDSLFRPIPFSDLSAGKKSGKVAKLFKIINSFEMLIFYLGLCFFFIYLLKDSRFLTAYIPLFICLMVVGLLFPNSGLIFRSRFSFYIILTAIGWSYLIDRKRKLRI